MSDCSSDVRAYHNDEVTLPQRDQDDMRDRRDANRDCLKKGLQSSGNPAPLTFVSQGSYAMKTMLRHPENDYDIDDGVYFDIEDLRGSRGGHMSTYDAKKMVRDAIDDGIDAIDDGSFGKDPEVRDNCVRIYYKKGYHVDIPVYRQQEDKDILGNKIYSYELASSEGWKNSDARDVTKWFDDEIKSQGGDGSKGKQMRRVTRMIKKFAKSRDSWNKKILSGFGITILVVECFCSSSDREDLSLYETMIQIRNRLNWDLVVNHPVPGNGPITNGQQDSKASFLRDRLTEAINHLRPAYNEGQSRSDTLKSWDRVFKASFFSDRNGGGKAAASPNVLTGGVFEDALSASQDAVQKKGSDRFA